MPERPFRRDSLDALRRRFELRDLTELALIAEELSYRTTRLAAALRTEVDVAIATLTPVQPVEPEPAPDAPLVFDVVQAGVVRAPVGDRVLVNAPPGTGKTAMACGRIAWLLDQDVPEHGIWLVSFTRTAVTELRTRIRSLAQNHTGIHGVVAGTIDARAWRIVNGFTAEGQSSLVSGYDYTIAAATRLLENPTHDLRERLNEVRQLIVDEAQDLVGERAHLVELLIRQAPQSAGVVVLCDEAQAIYGFSEDQEQPPENGARASLVESLRREMAQPFREVTLSQVYRTRSASLRQLYIGGREALLDAITREPGGAPSVMRDQIETLRDGPVDAEHGLPGLHDLLLYRSRIEALDEATRFASAYGQMRLRTSGLTRCIHPWIGILLATFQGERLSKAELDERWPQVETALGLNAPDADAAWTLLIEFARERTGVGIAALREVLGRSTPPDGFLTPEFGFSGPIFSTIHASKGREADDVRLYMTAIKDWPDAQAAEEARVLFVGASRARRSLRASRGRGSFAARLESGRAVRSVSNDRPRKARVEIGRDGDVDPIAPVHRKLTPNAAAAISRFTTLVARATAVTSCRAVCAGADAAYRYELITKPGDPLGEITFGSLTSRVNADLFGAAERLWDTRRVRLADYIDHLLWVGARTVALPVGDARLDDAHAPFARSGFWLAPIVVGLPTVPFF